jgi:hypothetical protein
MSFGGKVLSIRYEVLATVITKILEYDTVQSGINVLAL